MDKNTVYLKKNQELVIAIQCYNHSMNIIVSGLHLKKFPEMEEYAKEKVAKLYKYHRKIEKIQVRLIDKESHRDKNQDYYCEIEIDIPGRNLEIVDVEYSMDKAIDKAVERMKRLLVKDKEKRIERRRS